MKKTLFILILTLMISYSFAEPIIVKTKTLTWTLDPAVGGHITSLTDEQGRNYIGKDNFMLLDLCTQQDYAQGDLKFAPYECFIKEEGDTTVITLSNSFTTRDAAGVKLTKQLTFNKNTDNLNCKYTLSNPTDTNKKVGLWIQNICGPNDGIRWTYRPSTKGTIEYEYPINDPNYSQKNDFTFNLTQGFIGVLNKEAKMGVVFLPDYNWLKCIYSCMGGYTQEWWYSDTLIKPDKSFETVFTIVPFEGLDRIDFASSNYIMSKTITRDGNVATFDTQTLALGDYENKTIKITAKKYPDMNIIGEAEGKLTDKITSFSLKMDNLNSKDDIVYNVYFPDTNEEYEAFSAGVAVLYTETDYKIKAPKKIKDKEKPNLITRTPNEKLNILQARGLFADKYLFKYIAKDNFDYSEALYYSTDLGSGLKNFPEDYDDIFKYDIIVLNHIPANGFNEDLWDLLKDYVTYGGKVLFIGGPMCITGYDKEDDPSQILLPFEYKALSKIVKAKKPLENAGIYEYEVNVKTDTKVTDYLYKIKVGEGALYFFTPTVLSQEMEAEGFWNNPDYVEFMRGLIKKL